MSGIKGLVVLSRFDYIEKTYGREKLVQFFDSVKSEDKDQLTQPIGISKEYPDEYLKIIDEYIQKEFFANDESSFLLLGNWNAGHLMPRYFQIYMDDKNPPGFLNQMSNMRKILIGSGEMKIRDLDSNSYDVVIDYGQTFLESVRLSELGFIEEGLRLCGAKKVKTEIKRLNEITAEYKIGWVLK